ncbi:MAG: adenine/guanine/hypoxanthine permease [Candidatus Methanomethylophilaceae archaeon]|nr:adenine/guanine/hypoxanthine permease [Candidatus Methanomethylophilaceae archaeon]
MTVFTLGVVDTTGTFIALENEMGMLDKEGRLIDVQKPFIVDSLTIMFAGVIGTISSGVFVESETGMKSGARTGFPLNRCALGLSLFFSPIITAIPIAVTGPALMVVGVMMLTSIAILISTTL